MDLGVTGLQHIGVYADDTQASLDFYKKLGFEIAWAPNREGNRLFFLKNKNVVLELMGRREGTAAPLHGDAVDHIALDVEDIEKAYALCVEMGLIEETNKKCAELGARAETEVKFLPFWENGVKYFKVKGPNNEDIEFSQML